MDLYICEKPSQAKDLAGVMKASLDWPLEDPDTSPLLT